MIDKQVICLRRESKYFCKWGWTGRHSLIWLKKIAFSRTRPPEQKPRRGPCRGRSDQFRIACMREEILMVAKFEKVSETA
jgi:hypothetical protein